MNADSIRSLYAYHIAANRRLWDEGVMALTDAQYTQDIPYSLGSVRNHLVHCVSVDQRWFARLRQVDVPERLEAADFPDRARLRETWDEVEVMMQNYVDNLTEAQAAATLRYPTGRRGLTSSLAWRILVHVVNHGTDHRAQLLRMLHEFGAPTFEQDMMIYWWDMGHVADDAAPPDDQPK